MSQINVHGNVTHGKSRTLTYKVWQGIHQRCENPQDIHYRSYGARGIKVCDSWKSFENFYRDMGDKPEGYSIGRIDNDRDYEPKNCRWETTKQQAQNRNNTRNITYKGKTQSLALWATELGINYTTLDERIKNGWSVERAFTTRTRKYWRY